MTPAPSPLTRDLFLQKYPEVDPADLDHLRPPTPSRRPLAVAAAGVLAGVLLTALVAWWAGARVWDATERVAPEVANQLAEQKLEAARHEIVVQLRAGTAVAADFATFTEHFCRAALGLDDANARLVGIQSHVGSLRRDVGELNAIALIDTGAERVGAILQDMRTLVIELGRALGGTLQLVLDARSGVETALSDDQLQRMPPRLVEALSTALAPILADHDALAEEWAGCRMRFADWWADLDRAIETARAQTDGKLVAGEFLELLYPAVVEELRR